MSGFESIKNYLVDHAAAGDLVMTIGAGSINQLGASLWKHWKGVIKHDEDKTNWRCYGRPQQGAGSIPEYSSAIVEALKEKVMTRYPSTLIRPFSPPRLRMQELKSFFNAVHGLYGEDGSCRPSLKCLAFLTQGRAFFQAPLP